MTRKAAIAARPVDIGLTVLRPEDVAEALGISERLLRTLARKHGACSILGKTMILSPEDVDLIRAHNSARNHAVVRELKQEEEERLQRIGAKPRPLPAGTGYVYFVGGEDRVKIGFARNVKKRIAGIQTTCPFPIKVFLTYRAKFIHEQELHARFAEYHIVGEWFRHEGDLADYITSRGK